MESWKYCAHWQWYTHEFNIPNQVNECCSSNIHESGKISKQEFSSLKNQTKFWNRRRERRETVFVTPVETVYRDADFWVTSRTCIASKAMSILAFKMVGSLNTSKGLVYEKFTAPWLVVQKRSHSVEPLHFLEFWRQHHPLSLISNWENCESCLSLDYCCDCGARLKYQLYFSMKNCCFVVSNAF